MNKPSLTSLILFLLHFFGASAQRVPVLSQIDLPHNYYFRELYLPQLTSGPSSVAWSPDGKSLVFSMGGSLWVQEVESKTAQQLTDGNGYDYQPDWSPDGNQILFDRYNGSSIELMVLDLLSNKETALSKNGAVNLEPRWSPDGRSIAFVSTINSVHFLLYKTKVNKSALDEIVCLTPDRKSLLKRYYYSPFDHAINPVWSRDGKDIFFISNREIINGTGDIVMMNLDSLGTLHTIQHEETSWKARPDISPDGTRMVYSSYLGSNWHQLWLLPVNGGSPMPLTYGEYDNTSPRWSPDGKRIVFISNRNGNTSLWLVNAFDGGQKQVITNDFHFIKPHHQISITVKDENGNVIPARVSITDSREKFYAPDNEWIQADDSRYPGVQQYESHYFHCNGHCELQVPDDKLKIEVSHGPLYEIAKMEVDAKDNSSREVVITLKKLLMPTDFGKWWSGDLHVHMNYGGYYLNTPARMIQQAEAEDVNYVFNLIVNKEQRIPDVKYFSPLPDLASTNNTMLLHSQEFHTSFWGHLGLLHLDDHLIIPDYSGYPQTAAASLFPHNKFIADRAHDQHALVGYVHPFEKSEIFPELSSTEKNELPVDAALSVVDYYELVGFSDHKASEAIWYKLLNCGLHLPAGAGTDVMANYASLRGPVGLNRVYVKQDGKLNENEFLNEVKEGRSFVTNGPIIGLKINNATAGDTLSFNSKTNIISYSAVLRSDFPVNHIEIIWNGEVIASLSSGAEMKTLDTNGKIKINGSGWLLLRAWNDSADINLPDLYPYSSTNPIYIQSAKMQVRSKSAGEYFEKWLDQIEAATKASDSYRNEEERSIILNDITAAKKFYENCVVNSTIK